MSPENLDLNKRKSSASATGLTSNHREPAELSVDTCSPAGSNQLTAARFSSRANSCWGSHTSFVGYILLSSWLDVEKDPQSSKMTAISCRRRLPNESCCGCAVVNSRAHNNAPSCLFESSYDAARTFSWCTNTNVPCCSWSWNYKISHKNKQLYCQAHEW